MPIHSGIDTSCDVNLVTDGLKVLSNVVSSQVSLHSKYGGVVPMIAKREHEGRINRVVAEAIRRASAGSKLKAVAVTYGPGLAIALEVGIKKAKELALQYKVPLIGVNHLEGHLLSSLAENAKGTGDKIHKKLKFPGLGLVISGGHTDLVLIEKIGKYKLLGQTLDDAIGEAYDKAARMLGLGYPGGPVITEFAKLGDKDSYDLPVPMEKNVSLDFSFSGLKTALFYLVNKIKGQKKLKRKEIINLAASFENSAITELEIKLTQAVKQFSPSFILVGGGVAKSKEVRKRLRVTAKSLGVAIYFPALGRIYTDNAAMIAIAGYFKFLSKDFADDKLDRVPYLEFEESK
jgi:N6-L-threonylcarbamoyladenine synthase